MKKGLFYLFAVVIFMSLVTAQDIQITGNAIDNDDGFSIGNIILKVSLRDGVSADKVISISSESGGQFDLDVLGLKGVSLSEDNFVLTPGEKKEIAVSFDSNVVNVGAYAGGIKVTGSKDSKILPVVFEVESQDLFFDINLDIPPVYSEVSPGNNFVANVRVFDLSGFQNAGSLGQVSVDLSYSVVDVNGNFLSSESESVIVDKQAQFTKSIKIPEDAEEGDYFFITTVNYKSSLGIASHVFQVDSGSVLDDRFDFGGSSLFFLLVGFVFVVLIGFFVYVLKSRDKLLSDLKRYNNQEMREQRDFLVQQQKVAIKKKPAHKDRISREIKNKIKNLKRKHKKRISEFKSLRKKGKSAEMRKRLEQWKKAGYNTTALELKLSDLNAKDMKKIMGEWKSKYTQ